MRDACRTLTQARVPPNDTMTLLHHGRLFASALLEIQFHHENHPIDFFAFSRHFIISYPYK
jgi:hypothetical protein